MSATYLLPLRRGVAEQPGGELATYLRQLAGRMDVLVVDGSDPAVVVDNREAFGCHVRVAVPAPADRCANGKAWGVITGLRLARGELVVVADDDVRWDDDGLARVLALLDGADLVIPQNIFSPATWHTAWDTGRVLVNRAVGHDWPGTLALRRGALAGDPPYDGDVLFENCELVRTVRAAGGRVRVAGDLFVVRRPPTATHFLSQRPRQAYDDLAQPARLAVMLAVLPALWWGRRRALLGLAAGAVALAEVGRRRCGGRRAFPWHASLWAPLWLGERGILAWWVLGRVATRRGVVYSGRRLVRAATPMRRLRRHHGGSPGAAGVLSRHRRHAPPK